MPDANEHGLVDIDDIVDPMIRKTDAGLLMDRVKVLCNATKGPLHIEVYPRSWGSRGADRFLSLVRAGLFSTPVALHRAVKNFIIQFGTPGDGGAWSKSHQGEFPSIPDDPQWLPLGPTRGGKRKLGKGPCRRHRNGFMSFAGGKRNSRRIEMSHGYRLWRQRRAIDARRSIRKDPSIELFSHGQTIHWIRR